MEEHEAEVVGLEEPIEPEKIRWSLRAKIAVALVAAILVIAGSILTLGIMSGAYVEQSQSPELYFHVDETVVTDVTVRIQDGVTLTIPEVPMDQEATWEDVTISPDGTLTYEGEEYPFLYYEGRFSYPVSDMGWLVRDIDGQMYLGDVPVTEEELLGFLEIQFLASGLEQNEVEYMLHRIMDNDMLEFSSEYLFISYIPEEVVDEAIQLETSHEFQFMRRHFLITELNVFVETIEPVYEHVSGDYIVHETAVNKW